MLIPKDKYKKWSLHLTSFLVVSVEYIFDFKVAINSKIEYGRLPM